MVRLTNNKTTFKKSLSGKILFFIVAACFLTAILSATIYYLFGIRTLAYQLANEMLPRAYGISRLSSTYLDGRIGTDSFEFFLSNEKRDQSSVRIYDSQGNLMAKSYERDRNTTRDDSPYVLKVLQTNEVVKVFKYFENDGIIVGVPITDNMDRTNGVVIVSKEARELRASMATMTGTLLISGSIVSVILSLIFIFMSRRTIIKPIRQMILVSEQMASGNFSVKADDEGDTEISYLGSALNHLSGELSKNIHSLTATKDRLTTILSGLNEGIIGVDDSFLKVTYKNPAAEKLLKNNLFEFTPEEKEEYLSNCIISSKENKTTRVQLSRGDRKYMCTITKSASSSEDDTVLVLLILDVTEAVRLEQTRKEYVANVSHELKTPIASIRSLAETLSDGLVKTEEDKTRYNEYILRESMRLTRLINDLLELSRIQSGAVALNKEKVDLNKLLSGIADRMGMVAHESGINLTYRRKKLSPVMTNADRIEQVVISLLDNAIKYATDEGTIKIRANEEEKLINVEVRNTGHVDENDIPHLFERFYKSDKSHTEMGTGLGLAITSEILILLDETISVRNDKNEVVFSFTVHK